VIGPVGPPGGWSKQIDALIFVKGAFDIFLVSFLGF